LVKEWGRGVWSRDSGKHQVQTFSSLVNEGVVDGEGSQRMGGGTMSEGKREEGGGGGGQT